MTELTPLVQRLGAQAKRYQAYSDSSHSRGGEWTSSDTAADAQMAAWATALGMVLQDMRGHAAADADEASARKAGTEFVREHWAELGQCGSPADAGAPGHGTGPASRTIVASVPPGVAGPVRPDSRTRS
jgi:hypothetical protein